ncbi:16S rRNA (adenine1518-N6/adenine1519-N6)-dimethyltransferase [Allopseudospirillum japonicum]|uniref:Ribosomal RNA small subunit methyltransferase A n=1 Tax=Allopseudospirillum japonicum TaxID=64971 RepID=A0A1H6T963_9GAMM|nr:16S rRNA (adenine(1518)-N(6)/adenine(1519)-N(6))-dimethyltransferase RsmA [Allopseudospirillum japonicum]SEI74684.1 16S rRNA (adenine1518-N6/adenine1519-N6)-dimethyltransferase [Allopseudospirillum japonicum]
MKVHQARKRFGQNFLQDAGVIHNIVKAIAPNKNEHLVEIGPGMGALTQEILQYAPRLDALELDRDLIPGLRVKFFQHENFQVHAADALNFAFETLLSEEEKQGGKQLRVVGNLPYNISTPLIFHLLQQAPYVQDMHFMLQKEVVERLGAQPNTRDWGRLSVMTQYYCHVQPLFLVPPHAFHPQPKVDSAIVRLTPYAELPLKAISEDLLADTVRAAFAQRRKTLRNNLKGVMALELLQEVGIDAGRRPETLSLAEFVAIANARAQVDLHN